MGSTLEKKICQAPVWLNDRSSDGFHKKLEPGLNSRSRSNNNNDDNGGETKRDDFTRLILMD